ncbi:MAG: FAD-dependent oxidoreductase [Thermoanaerobaculia bacterium]|nr:FAD-dependent oxidoreductase [Thermoanaerobaculia bacterium]
MQAETKTIGSRSLTPSTHWITVARPPGFRFEPGQHAMVKIATPSGADDRFLSIASAPSDDHLDFAVRLSDSDFKQAFSRLKPGDPVNLIGPAGRFQRDPNRPALLLSGGIGITPLRSMLRDAVHRSDLPLTALLYGNRSPDEIPFRSELDGLAETGRVQVVHTVDSADASWKGPVGHIDQGLLEQVLGGFPQPPKYYLCGPPGMVEAMSHLLTSLEIDNSDILHEPFNGY